MPIGSRAASRPPASGAKALRAPYFESGLPRFNPGKTNSLRRTSPSLLGWALDPRSFKVHPIAAPDEHERAQHYLQRFWRRLPEKGQIVAFDRSWYGRVLVERVEGFVTNKEWRRAYREINKFELMLVWPSPHRSGALAQPRGTQDDGRDWTPRRRRFGAC
jgi:hypothetical protein